MKTTFYLNILGFLLSWQIPVHAQSPVGTNALVPEVEWYSPETEKGANPRRPRVIISGRTQPESIIQIDGDSVTVLKAKQAPAPSAATENPSDEVERKLKTNCRAYELPGAKAKVLGGLRKGRTLKVMEYSDTWYVVSLNTQSAFLPKSCFYSSRSDRESSAPAPTANNAKIESVETRANLEGFFELALELPEGLVQIPVSVTSPTKSEKTFLISVDVSSENIKVANTNISPRKPPAAGKKFRFWAGVGSTYQTYQQGSTVFQDLQFNTFQSPAYMIRGGYWGERWGLDLFLRDAPGKIEVDPPFQLESGDYHWQTIEAKGLYQFSRSSKSRIWGLPSQWQLRFGAQMHHVPFITVDGTNKVSVRNQSVTTATLGTGLLLGQERAWSYEFALGLQYPLSSSGEGGDTFSISSPVAFEAQVGAAYKFAQNWRLGVFSYLQSLNYNYSFESSSLQFTGTEKLFYTTFDLRLGYEF